MKFFQMRNGRDAWIRPSAIIAFWYVKEDDVFGGTEVVLSGGARLSLLGDVTNQLRTAASLAK